MCRVSYLAQSFESVVVLEISRLVVCLSNHFAGGAVPTKRRIHGCLSGRVEQYPALLKQLGSLN